MKKTILIASVLLMGTIGASQAQGLYAGVMGGYGLAAVGQSNPSTTQSTTTNNNMQTGVNTTSSTNGFTSAKSSLGKGVNIGIYGGYMFSKYLGAELEISDVMGGTSTSTSTNTTATTTTDPTGNVSNSASSDDNTYTYKGSMIRITPAIRLQVGDGNIHPYMVAGIIIGVSPKYTSEDVETTTATGSPSTSFDEITTYNGGSSMGFHSALGVSYQLNDKISIFGEISANYQNYAASKGIITTATYNGADQLPGMTTSQKETDYSSSASTTTTNGNPASPASPQTAAYQYQAFSSLGFNVGLNFNFGGASK
ncbi:MAG: hypothetical protein ABI199_05310 [Bacteroidia bacterium]